MRRSAKYKEIKKLASVMPVLEYDKSVPYSVKGAELIKEGIKEYNGEPVHIRDVFAGVEIRRFKIDHEKNMKVIYNKHGAAGVRAYVQSVEDHANG